MKDCNNCPKAYDFTCSAANALRCEVLQRENCEASDKFGGKNMWNNDYLDEMLDILRSNGIQFRHSDLYNNAIHVVTTEPISCRVADKLYRVLSRIGDDNVSVLKIGATPGRSIIVMHFVVSKPVEARMTAGKLVNFLSKVDPDTEIVVLDRSSDVDCFIYDATVSTIQDDDMYGKYLDEFPDKSALSCEKEPEGKSVIVLCGN